MGCGIFTLPVYCPHDHRSHEVQKGQAIGLAERAKQRTNGRHEPELYQSPDLLPQPAKSQWSVSQQPVSKPAKPSQLYASQILPSKLIINKLSYICSIQSAFLSSQCWSPGYGPEAYSFACSLLKISNLWGCGKLIKSQSSNTIFIQLLRKINKLVDMIKRSILILFALLALYTVLQPTSSLSTSAPSLDLACGFTSHFQQFLTNNYAGWGFDRPDLKCGAYGGKSNSSERLNKVPIIFIHGNSDIAFGRGTEDGYLSWQTGFRDLATYFGSQGYSKAELYTTTWGPANSSVGYQNNHAKKYVQRMRAFVEAVLAYTNASQINVIGHSMGVSIGRKVIKGGSAEDEKEGVYNVGGNLTARIKSFVGLAGANLGLNACLGQYLLPTCSNIDGFDPGSTPLSGPSKFLSEINNSTIKEGTNTYTIWSKYDDLILNECAVWGKITSRIPQQTEEVIKNTKQWTHFYVRDQAGLDLIKWM